MIPILYPEAVLNREMSHITDVEEAYILYQKILVEKDERIQRLSLAINFNLLERLPKS